MSDIADELRAFEGSEALANGDFSVCVRGAAEITRLRAALATARQDGMEAITEKIAGWHDAQAQHYDGMEREFRTIAEHLDPDAMQSAIRCAQGASQHRQRAAEIRAAAKEGNQL